MHRSQCACPAACSGRNINIDRIESRPGTKSDVLTIRRKGRKCDERTRYINVRRTPLAGFQGDEINAWLALRSTAAEVGDRQKLSAWGPTYTPTENRAICVCEPPLWAA